MGTLRCLIKEGVKIKGGNWRFLLNLINGGWGGGVGVQNKRGGGGVGISKNLLTSVMDEKRNINVLY